jgi:hypothetical protein
MNDVLDLVVAGRPCNFILGDPWLLAWGNQTPAKGICFGVDDAAARLGVSTRTLRELIGQLPDDLRPLNVSTGSERATYRWVDDQWTHWVEGVRGWQASANVRKPGDGKSPGETRTEGSGASASLPVQKRKLPKNSKTKSKDGSWLGSMDVTKDAIRSRRKKQ